MNIKHKLNQNLRLIKWKYYAEYITYYSKIIPI